MSPISREIRFSALLLAVPAAGCARDVDRPAFEFSVLVESDGEPLPGAVVQHDGIPLGTTGSRGAIGVRARGREGERLALDVLCPTGFRSPERPTLVTVRRTSEAEQRTEYRVSCPPEKRKVVVAVRAQRGPNLPVKVLDQEVARTDGSGIAHVLLEGAPEEILELTLDTSAEPRLRPKSPTARFAVGSRDEIALLNQSFELAPLPRARRQIPIRIR